jgi:hypothetical protein
MSTLSANTVLNDLASIDANRFGQITPWQRQHLPPPPVLGWFVALALSGAVAIAVVCCFLVWPLWTLLPPLLPDYTSGAPLFSSPNFPLDLIIPGFFLGVTGLFLWVVSRWLLIPCTGRLLFNLRLRWDLANGMIAQEDGQVTFARRRGYVARGRRRPLRSLHGSWEVNLPPGAYRFYYLPHSRRILSAERQALLEPGGPAASLLSALATAHGFRPGDLHMNWQGRMSLRQRFALVGWMLLLFMFIPPVLAIYAVAALLGLALTSGSPQCSWPWW